MTMENKTPQPQTATESVGVTETQKLKPVKKPKPIKRERITCKKCKKEVIKETWNHGGVYYYTDMVFAMTPHRCKGIEGEVSENDN